MSSLIVIKGNNEKKHLLAKVLAKLNYYIIDYDKEVKDYLTNKKYEINKINNLRISLKFNLENRMFNKEEIVLLSTHINCKDLKEIEDVAKFHGYEFFKRKV